MPYANNTAFARQMRAYVGKKRRLKGNSKDAYESWLTTAGQLLNWKNPKAITVGDLERLESRMMTMYSETTVKNYMGSLVRMLKKAKNRAVDDYEMLCMQQPDQHPVWLTEEQLAHGRLVARSLSVVHELIYSLMADNGLRPVDVSLLTIQNAKELLRSGKSVILGKGRGEGKRGLLVFSPITRKPLQEYLALRRTYPGSESMQHLLLSSVRGELGPMTPNAIGKRMLRILRSVGVAASAKDLRKTFLNRVWTETHDEWLTARMGRHSSPGTSFRHYIGAMEDLQTDVQTRLAKKCPEWISQSVEGG